MKKQNLTLIVLLLIIAGSFASCKEKEEKVEDKLPLSKNEIISTNLLKNSSINPQLLLGGWKCKEFAFTEDGLAIVSIVELQAGNILVRDQDAQYSNYWYYNGHAFSYSLSNHLINIICSVPYTFVNAPREEADIAKALNNTYSFSIKEDTLIFYFIGINNRNLLIFERSAL